MPYGYYDTGMLLSLNAANRSIYGSGIGVNRGYEHGVPAIAGGPDSAMDDFSRSTTPSPALLSGNAGTATYTRHI